MLLEFYLPIKYKWCNYRSNENMAVVEPLEEAKKPMTSMSQLPRVWRGAGS